MVQFTENYRTYGNVSLSDEQIEGVNFLLSRSAALLCFQTGLGKTLTTLVTAKIILDTFDSARVIIVCPVKAKKAFKKEMGRMGLLDGSYSGFIATDEIEFDRYHNKIFLFTDTNIKKYYELVQDLKSDGHNLVLFVDEAHKLADIDSGFYKVMQEVKKYVSVTYLVTATPLINDLDGLYNIVNFACPKFLGTKTEFNNTYTNWHLETIYLKGGRKQKTRVIDSYKNLSKLNEKLKQVLIVRGNQYDLKFTKQFRDLTEAEYQVYEKVSSGILGSQSLERNFSKRMHDLQRFIDRAYTNDEELVELVREYGSEDFSTKEELLIDTIKAALSKNYSLIIYASYKDTIDRLHQVLKSRRLELNLGRIYEITGSINIKTREAVEERINPNDVVLITSAGTESINLQKCNCVIFYDIPFSSKEIVQCIGRITRVDTKHSSQYIIFCGTNNTIDEYKYLLFQQHLDVIQRAINVGTDIPLEDMQIDTKLVKELREQLLWKYKGDPITKKLRKLKRDIRGKIYTSSLVDSGKVQARNKFLIEPLDSQYCPDVKSVSVLYPDTEKYTKFVNGEIPFTVLRSSYIQYLQSDRGKDLIKRLIDGVNSSGDLLLVGNTGLPEVLKKEILDSII